MLHLFSEDEVATAQLVLKNYIIFIYFDCIRYLLLFLVFNISVSFILVYKDCYFTKRELIFRTMNVMFYNIENIFSNSNNMYSKKFNRKGKHITLNYSWILFILLRKERNNAIAFLKWKNFWWHRETLLELVDWFQLSRDCLMVAAVEQKLKSFF